MNVNAFYAKLDELFARNRIEEAGAFLREQLAASQQSPSEAGVMDRLTVLNEWLGYCRSLGLEEEGVQAARECRELLVRGGLEQELSLVNAWINIATTLCRFGYYEEGLACYSHAQALLQGAGTSALTPDILYARAALNNNMASALLAKGDEKGALEAYREALALLEQHPDREGCLHERALTYANMAYIREVREYSLHEMQELLALRECRTHADYAHTCEKCAAMLEMIAEAEAQTDAPEAARLTALAAQLRGEGAAAT